MEEYLYFIGIAVNMRVLKVDRLIRLIFFKIAYPNATLKQIENFEKNTQKEFSKLFTRKSRDSKN